MFSKLNNFIFYLFILLLPFTSMHLFPMIFRGWNGNLAMPIFYIGLLLLFIKLLIKKEIILDLYTQKIIKDLATYMFIFYFITIVMDWYLVIFDNIHIFSDNIIPIYSPKLMLFVMIFLVFLYSVMSFNSIRKLKIFIRLTLIAFFVMELYGYLQIYTLFFKNNFLYDFYLYVESFLDKGWGGKNIELFGGIPMSIFLFRINLLTPEPSSAAYYILTYCYPFILASVISDYSIFKKKFFIKIETFLFILSIPLIIFTFSTSGYVVFILLLALTFILSLFDGKNKFRHKLKIIFFFLILIFLLFLLFIDNYDYIIQIFDKLYNTSNGSTHTRLFGIIGGLFIFLNYPFGIGFANLRYVFYDYLPKPLNSEQLLEYSTGQAFQPKSLFIIYLDSFGLIGLLIAIYFFYKIYKNLRNIKNISKFSLYVFYSFIIFLFSFLLESFNNSSFSILWMWVLIGFFISASNKRIYFKDL
jgi:hypothetical protein